MITVLEFFKARAGEFVSDALLADMVSVGPVETIRDRLVAEGVLIRLPGGYLYEAYTHTA